MLTGTQVQNKSTGEQGVVLEADGGSLVKVAFASGIAWLSPDELQGAPEGPEDRLIKGRLGSAESYALRLQALYLKHAYRYDPLTGLSSARIEPKLHQVFVAHRVAQKLAPRMILADEVGLGKTIEAGLIIKELRARRLIERVLIIVPASLQLQWQSEMRSKFNEEFEVVDGDALKYLGKGGVNPWSSRPNVICSIALAARQAHAERIAESEWDLVVVDEAHRVRRSLQGKSKIKTTLAYRLADELKEVVNGLLLLTATPMQLHPFELFSLIELIEPGLFPTFEAYDSCRKSLPRLNKLMKALKGWDALSKKAQARVPLANEGLLAELGVCRRCAARLLAREVEREKLMDELVGKHPVAEVLVRNRKVEVGGFTRRTATTVPVDLDVDEQQIYEDVSQYLRVGYNRAVAEKNRALGFVMVAYQKMLASSSHALRTSLARRVTKLHEQLEVAEGSKPVVLNAARLDELQEAEETSTSLEEVDGAALDSEETRIEIAQIDELVRRLGQVRDSKAAALVELLKGIAPRDSDRKVVVFTQFIETQTFLAATLSRNGYGVSTFNGRMSSDDKENAIRSFRERDQILVSTEAGGEGRNLQFSHLLVNYDLPWNPMKIEQRIGRLDRIGQKHPVRIYNLACSGTVEDRVLDVLDKRIGLFEESVGSLDAILGDVESDIEALVLSNADQFDKAFPAFEADLEDRVREARVAEQTLADFVLDRASLRRDKAAELLNESPLAHWSDLERFAGEALTYFGGALKDHAKGGKVIALSPQLSHELRQRAKTIRGTFDPEVAREQEELPFFAFGKDLVDRLVELPTQAEDATTASRRLGDVPVGIFIEIFYEIRGSGIRPRGRIIRHLVDVDRNVRSQDVSSVPTVGLPAPGIPLPEWREMALAASREVFEGEYAEERDAIIADDEATKEEAIARAKRIYDYRRIRLSAMIDEQDAWICEKEVSGTERDLKVLPARRGKLAKDRERLAVLHVEHEQEVQQIKERQPGASARVLAAGLVIGEG